MSQNDEKNINLQYPDDIELTPEQEQAIRMAIGTVDSDGGSTDNQPSANHLSDVASEADFSHLAAPKKHPGKTVLKVFFILVIVGLIGFGTWFFWWTQYAVFDYELQPVVILDGSSVTPDMFLPDYEHAKGVTAAFKNPDFAPVSGYVTVPLTLSFGLRSLETNASLYVLTPVANIPHEYREEAPDLEPLDLFSNSEIVRNVAYSAEFTETPSPLADYAVGLHTLYATLNDEPFTVYLTVADTTVPTAVPQDVTVWIGDTVTPDMFVTDVSDSSEIASLVFAGNLEGEPFYNAYTSQIVEVNISDIHGNTSVYAGSLTVLKNESPPAFLEVPYIIESMMDMPVNYPGNVLVYDDFGRELEYIIDDSGVDTGEIGEYTALYIAEDLTGLRTEIPVTVYIIEIDPALVDRLVDEMLDEILTDDMDEEQKLRAIFNTVRKILTPVTSESDNKDREWMGSVYAPAHYALNNPRGSYYHFYALSEVMLTRAGFVNIRIERSPSSRVGTPHFWNLIYSDDDYWYHFDSMPITNDNDINSIQHMFTQTQADEIAKFLAESRSFGKEGYYEYIKDIYPDVKE